MRLRVRSLPLLSGLTIRRCHELWCRLQTRLGSTLLWLWRRPVATALIRPLAWEPPYAMGVALKGKKIKERKKKFSPVFLSTFRQPDLSCPAVVLGGDPKNQKLILGKFVLMVGVSPPDPGGHTRHISSVGLVSQELGILAGSKWRDPPAVLNSVFSRPRSLP